MSEEIKVVETEIKIPWYNKLYMAIFYNEERTYFSRSAMMNFLFFVLAITVGISGLILLISDYTTRKVLNVPYAIAFFSFITTLVGGGLLNYNSSKKLATEAVKVISGKITGDKKKTN